MESLASVLGVCEENPATDSDIKFSVTIGLLRRSAFRRWIEEAGRLYGVSVNATEAKSLLGSEFELHIIGDSMSCSRMLNYISYHFC